MEEQRREFNAMLDAVREEVDREGVHALDDVLIEMDTVLGEQVG